MLYKFLEDEEDLLDCLAIIGHGKIIAVDTTEHLKQTYGGSVVELETVQPSDAVAQLRALAGVKDVVQDSSRLTITTQDNSNVVPQIINVISHQGEIHSIAVREPNLDEVLLRLTATALRG